MKKIIIILLISIFTVTTVGCTEEFFSDSTEHDELQSGSTFLDDTSSSSLSSESSSDISSNSSESQTSSEEKSVSSDTEHNVVSKPESKPAPPSKRKPTPNPKPAPAPKPEPAPSPNTANDNTIGREVYITPTGKRYHFNSSCGGKNSYPTSLSKAKQMGLTPCKKCANG